MITTNGKLHIKKYLAGIVPSIGGSIALGIGDGAESVNDTSLGLEIDRMDVDLVSYDFPANKLVFKAQIPEDYAGKIYEVALYSKNTASRLNSKILTTFDSTSEAWLNGASASTFVTTNTRVGNDSLNHTPAASGSTSSNLGDIFLDMSTNSGSDLFKFAYNLATATTSSIRFRFLTDLSNYYDFTINSGMTAGYKVISVAKSTAIATGAPNWANIIAIQVTTNSGAGGASNVEFDAIRVEDASLSDLGHVMVSRELISAPFTKKLGTVQEVEFTMDVSV